MVLRLLLALSLSLYAKQTSALDVNDLKLDEKIIFKGEKAEFDGVLVPENNYRWYQGEVETCDYIRKQERNICMDNIDEYFNRDFLTIGLSLAIGFGLGFVAFREH